MPNFLYDSFGEPLPQAQAAQNATPPRLAQRLALFPGAGLFWTLVVVILSARIFYFDGVASTFSQFAAASRALVGG